MIELAAPIEQTRARVEMAFGSLLPIEGARIEPVDAGGVPAEWVRMPESSDRATILFLHGGGYNWGSPRTHRAATSTLARGAAARVLTLDYRLAPEHPHPAALEDAVAAYRWLLGQGVAPGSIAISGDSAGGGLAVALLVKLRDDRLPLPAAAYLMSPWVDLASTGASWRREEDDPIVSRAMVDATSRHYLNGLDPKTPLASPLYADLSGLPPLLVQAGTREVLLDDSARLVDKAKAAGVAAVLDILDGMIHAVQLFAGVVPEAHEALSAGARFLHEHLHARASE